MQLFSLIIQLIRRHWQHHILKNVKISDNIITEPSDKMFKGFIIGAAQDVYIKNNKIRANNNIGIAIDYSTNIFIEGNDITLENLSSTNSRYGLSIVGSQGYIKNNIVTGWETFANVYIRTTYADIEGEFKEQPLIDSGATGKVIFHATVIPTSSSFEIGSIAINDSPASTGYIGWVYTSTGWKGYGLIA